MRESTRRFAPRGPQLPRVVITGVGLTSPNGDDLQQYRSNLLKAKTNSISISKANQPSNVILRATEAAMPCLKSLGYES